MSYGDPVVGVQQGWVCPVCGEVNAPFMPSCVRAHGKSPTNAVSAQCTCGTTAVCPVHAVRSVPTTCAC